MSKSIGFDENLRAVFEGGNEAWKRLTRRAWHEFFIDGVAYQSDWLGAIKPELTRAYLEALAQLHGTDGVEYERARRMVDVTRRELLESFEGGPERPKQ